MFFKYSCQAMYNAYARILSDTDFTRKFACVYVTKEAPSPSLRRKRKNTKTHIETNKHKGIYEFFPADSTRIPPLP